MTSPDPDNFDIFLASALQSRPEAVPAIDLAAEVLARVRCHQTGEARLAIVARWKRFATIGATLLIGVIFAIGYARLPASTSTETATLTTTATNTTIDLTTLGLAVFIIALITVVVMTLMTPERQRLRIACA